MAMVPSGVVFNIWSSRAIKQDHVHVDFLDVAPGNEARNQLLPEHHQKCFHKFNYSVVKEPVSNC